MPTRIEPTKPQFEYLTSNAQYPAMVSGFGAGKTEAAILRSIIGKLKYPQLNRGFYEPTYDLVRMIAFPRFEELLSKMQIPYKLYKSPLNYINIEGYGNIFFRSMENPNRIIGYEHADADVDELDTLKPDDAADVWNKILARNRQKKPDKKDNTVGVTTTPEGFRFVYKQWAQNPGEGYCIIQAPTYSNPHLPENYVDSLRAVYPKQLLDAYIEGRFVNLASGTVYNSFERNMHNSNETIKPKETLFIGCDFNVTKQAAAVFVKRDGGKQWHAVDELVDMYDTPEMIQIISERWKSHGHHIVMYPDASGASRKTVGASVSDISLMQQAGFEVRANKSNPAVRDRIMSVNAAFENQLLFVNVQKCPHIVTGLEQQAYDKNGQPDKSSDLDHINDAVGYPVAYEMPIRKPILNIGFNFAM